MKKFVIILLLLFEIGLCGDILISGSAATISVAFMNYSALNLIAPSFGLGCNYYKDMGIILSIRIAELYGLTGFYASPYLYFTKGLRSTKKTSDAVLYIYSGRNFWATDEDNKHWQIGAGLKWTFGMISPTMEFGAIVFPKRERAGAIMKVGLQIGGWWATDVTKNRPK